MPWTSRCYYETGSLDRVVPGIYKRKGERPHWMGAIRLLQEELGKALHVSGRTALELHGSSHYASLGKKQTVYLISYEKARPPNWFLNADFDCEFVFSTSVLFRNERELSQYVSPLGLQIKISCRELAFLELLNVLDLSDSFETAENYLSSLTLG